uniref:Uncharacterized protein n=1 Tax=Rhizophora mucronata TaxID=61149 RepID=A0A2P2PH04_RHIMU
MCACQLHFILTQKNAIYQSLSCKLHSKAGKHALCTNIPHLKVI